MVRASRRVLPTLLAAALAGCAPWRSDIELTPGVAAAPVLPVEGWQPPMYPTGPRHVAFGPWTADRHREDDGWLVILRHDSSLVGDARCRSVWGEPRGKGDWRQVPDEALTCDLVLAGQDDTLHLEMKSDMRGPMAGRAVSEDWTLGVRGAGHLRTRDCFVLSTCGWYLDLDGMDIAAVEADARAWVYLSPDLGEELRRLAALTAGVLLLREDPAASMHRPAPPAPVGH